MSAVNERKTMKIKLPDQQVNVTTLKQFWMRVSFRDAVKLGMGFALGASIMTFVVGLFWFLIRLMFLGVWTAANVSSIPM
jgi:pheromone shutdown protein TraB